MLLFCFLAGMLSIALCEIFHLRRGNEVPFSFIFSVGFLLCAATGSRAYRIDVAILTIALDCVFLIVCVPRLQHKPVHILHKYRHWLLCYLSLTCVLVCCVFPYPLVVCIAVHLVVVFSMPVWMGIEYAIVISEESEALLSERM